MTERFQNIEDETFPSFLSQSLGSNCSGILGNVTLSSNLGLPVAASTVAKNKTGQDNRVPDAQASYLEDGGSSLPSEESSRLSQESDPNLKGKFALRFKDDLEDVDKFIGTHEISSVPLDIGVEKYHLTHAMDKVQNGMTAVYSDPSPDTSLGILPLEHLDDLSTGLITLPQVRENKVIDTNGQQILEKEVDLEMGSDQLNTSLSSFLENEKLSLASLEEYSTDDDIDDEELNDERIEAYFKQLVPPGMQRGDVEGQELPCFPQLPLKVFSGIPNDGPKNQGGGHVQLEDYDEDNFQMPHIRLAATGMDSAPASDEEDTEDELEAVRKENAQREHYLLPSAARQLVGESTRPGFRPGLEGGSSDDDDDDSSVRTHNVPNDAGIEFRRSAEGQVISSPVTGDGGGGGDGSSGSEEDGNNGGIATVPSFPSNIQTSLGVLQSHEIVGRNVAGEEDGDYTSVPLQGVGRDSIPGHNRTEDRVGPVGNGEVENSTVLISISSASNRTLTQGRQEALDAMDHAEMFTNGSGGLKLDSIYFKQGRVNRMTLEQPDICALQGLHPSFHLSQIFPHQSDEELGLRDVPYGHATFSKLPASGSVGGENAPADSESGLAAAYLSPTYQSEDCIDASPPHGVVYQNEEGKWVTDLAYYTSFDKELQSNNLPSDLVNDIKDGEFITGFDAAALIAEDQEEFEKEHKFIQEEKMDPHDVSLGIGDTSWRLPSCSYIQLRASQVTSDFETEEQSYLRLSLGEFFGQRSEALGRLGGGDDIKRPSFGYHITSPEKRIPVALIDESGGSTGVLEQNDTSRKDEPLAPEDLVALPQEKQNMFSTFLLRGNDPAQDDKSINVTLHQDTSEKLNKELPHANVKPKCTSGMIKPFQSGAADSMLSISTIASAIADASISADPTQLATMIMELSNKSKKKALCSGATQKANFVRKNQALFLGTFQKSETVDEQSILDMEKYLRKCEISSNDNEVEDEQEIDIVSESIELPNRSILHQSASQETLSIDLISTGSENNWHESHMLTDLTGSESSLIKQSDVNESLSRTRGEIQGSLGTSDQSLVQNDKRLCDGSSKNGASKVESNKCATRNSNTSSKLAVTEKRQLVDKRTNVKQSVVNTSTKVIKGEKPAVNKSYIPKRAVAESAAGLDANKTKLLSENKLLNKPVWEKTNVACINNPPSSVGLTKTSPVKNAASAGSNIKSKKSSAISHTDEQKLKDFAKADKDNRKVNKDGKSQTVKDANEMDVMYTHEKHVSFEEPSTVSIIPRTNQHGVLKPSSPDHGVGCLEDDQDSFRPSTCPLIHSSPSQASETSISAGTLSGAAVSRSACGVPLSPQSVYSSPSLSRLTYISTSDVTLQNSTLIPRLENLENDHHTLELSTTIVQASPTPSAEQTLLEESRTSLPEQKDGTVSPRMKPCNSVGLKSHTAGSCVGKPEKESCNKSTQSYSPGKEKDRHEESAPSVGCLDHVSLELSKKSSGFQQPLSVNVDNNMLTWQDCAHRIQSTDIPPTLNFLPGSGRLGLFAPNVSDARYVAMSNFKPLSTTSDLSSVSSAVPTLLTGRSLLTNPLAQQYLGTVSQAANPSLPLYHVGTSVNVPSSNTYGFSVELAGPNISAEHIQNSVSLGIPVGPPVGSGLMAAPQLYSAHPAGLNPDLLNVAKSYSGQSADINGLGQWGTRVTAETGHVVIPDELKFPHACCIGIASQTSLNIFNPTERWLQVKIAVASISINGEKVDTMTCQCLIFKNKTIVGPHTTEDVKILFLPNLSGVFQCILSVSSYPVSADADNVARAEALAKRVVLTAVAENPSIQVEAGNTECLDFGDLTSGSVKALPLKLINRTHATVPIRLVISANASAWRCFTFSKKTIDVSESALQTGRISPLVAPSVLNHVMHASYDGEDPEAFMVWVHFRAPQKYSSSSDSLGAADEYLARVDVEVDSPGPSNVIKSIPLHARTGIARIHAPKDLQTLQFSTKVGTIAKQSLPLKNAGNIAVHLKIETTDSEECFSAKPEDLFLQPGEEKEVAVSFTSLSSKAYKESMLTILVQPSGPQYEVVLKSEVQTDEMSKPVPSTLCKPTEVPPILSNKQFMAWGGVTLGRAAQQKLVLRNNSTDATHQLRLLIRGQDQDCFQLQSTFGPEERLTNNREITIHPKEDVNVHLLFVPTRVSCMLAKLEIKQSGIRSTQPGVKFTIPLSGYGGTSNIILEDVKKLSDSYVVTLNDIVPCKVSSVSFCMRNTGSRAAYVKAVCFLDLQTKTFMDSKVINVSPEQFVLKERTQEIITITCYSTRREQALCKSSTSLLSTVCFFCGDEVSRQQLRRALSYKPEAAKQILSENSLLKSINFNEVFTGEEQVTEVYDLPQRPNDVHLFYGNLNKVILSVVGNCGLDGANDADYISDTHQPSSRLSPESDSGLGNSDRPTSSTSLDVLPVRGPQGPPLALGVADLVQNKSLEPQKTWTIQPEQLILTAPSISGATETGHIQIVNKSIRVLKFELSWPAHCLTVTPQHGIVDPQSCLLILVSPNPSLATKSSVLPWSGQVYVQCDNQQKLIKVQIREDVALDASTSTAKPLKGLTAQPQAPIIHMAKPLPKPPSTKIEIKNRTILFPPTVSGDTSESFLEIENCGEEDVRWYLSSFAPPYVKGVDESGDVYRATYSAFRCSRVSGMLEAYGKLKVAITFLPRDRGDYSQFWDLECHPATEPHMKHKIQFQLCGEGVKEAMGGGNAKAITTTLMRTEMQVKPRRRSGSEASAFKAGQDGSTQRGVYAPEDLYTFPPTRVGESSTLKVNLRNSSFSTHMIPTLHQLACPIQTGLGWQFRGAAGCTHGHMRKSRYSTYW
ncbi:centrosomal protein of 192 kDa isoform X3 [Latimeria chalumnae]|uniref:centrosomal protein of 192 kDa isoform X3 n=1 Tax=Latimeria chalumnae TaxID=7897 RepID=UPI00313B6B74